MKTPQSASVLPPAYTVVLVRGKELQTIFAVWSLTTKIGTRKTSQRAPDDPLANSLASGKGRFPPPWTAEQIPGGFKVLDANGQSFTYVYGRETKADAEIAKVLTID